MILQGGSNMFFSSGVPLFILITGYLNARKVTFDRRYVRGMAKVLLAYVFFCIVTFMFKGYMVDRVVYPFFISRFYENHSQFGKWFFIVVPLVLLCSAVIAQFKQWLFQITRLDRT